MNESTTQINPRPRVPLGTPEHIRLTEIILRDHKLFDTKLLAAGGTRYMCDCSPQALRSDAEYRNHVAAIIVGRLVNQLELEDRIAQERVDRAAGLLCEDTSSLGSPCSRVKDHDGDHRSVYGPAWNDETKRRSAEQIARQLEGRRD